MKNLKRILYSGGGTGGSVTPLLALHQELIANNSYIVALWVGTGFGPEQAMAKEANIDFRVIKSGKLRRYFSLQNFFDPLRVAFGFFEAIAIMRNFKPDIAITAGGFVSVPVIWAAKLLGITTIVHQQDARPGLANKLMAPFATIITVTFKKSLEHYGKKAILTGNPVKKVSVNINILAQRSKYNFNNILPIVLVMGGGTGARKINELINEGLKDLCKFTNIIHITGKGKNQDTYNHQTPKNYMCLEFVNHAEMYNIYALADIVVSRAGMGALTELSYLKKPAIIIPMLSSHQEDNAKILGDTKAAIVLDQKKLTAVALVSNIKTIIENKTLQNQLSINIEKAIKTDGAKEIAKIINK